MRRSVLLDTGPLLALIDKRDQYHAWGRSQFATIEAPLLTCEPVLTESCFLAQRELGRTESLFALLDHGVVRLAFGLDANRSEVTGLMDRYCNVPMSLADACLVRMSELLKDCTVLTLDNDFRFYRRNRRQCIPLLIPESA